MLVDLGLLDTDPAHRERADAARNRKRVLEAAAKLFAERGLDYVTMNDIAQAAGVGKGTLYRRFGDRATLVLSLLPTREAELEEELIRGDPPLGSSASAIDRLHSFGQRVLEFRDEHLDMFVAAERAAPVDVYERRPYAELRPHLTVLLREAAPEIDVEMAADALLAPLAADFLFYLRRHRGMSMNRIVAAWHAMLDGLLAG